MITRPLRSVARIDIPSRGWIRAAPCSRSPDVPISAAFPYARMDDAAPMRSSAVRERLAQRLRQRHQRRDVRSARRVHQRVRCHRADHNPGQWGPDVQPAFPQYSFLEDDVLADVQLGSHGGLLRGVAEHVTCDLTHRGVARQGRTGSSRRRGRASLAARSMSTGSSTQKPGFHTPGLSADVESARDRNLLRVRRFGASTTGASTTGASTTGSSTTSAATGVLPRFS